MSDAVERDGVWVYTRDPENVEKVARALFETPGDYPGDDTGMAWGRHMARAALAALEES